MDIWIATIHEIGSDNDATYSSAHRTEEGAQKAIEIAKAMDIAEMQEYEEGYDEDRWDEDHDWHIERVELQD